MEYDVENGVAVHEVLLKPARMWPGRDFEFDLYGYSDSNYATDPDNRRSVMSHQVFLEGCCVSAKLKQMPFVNLSVTEAELAAAVDCACDMFYVKRMLEGMGLKVILPIPLFVDNEEAVNANRNYISGGCTRHTAVQINFLQELHEAGMIALQNISGFGNRVDIGMKNTDKTTFERHGVPLFYSSRYRRPADQTGRSLTTKRKGTQSGGFQQFLKECVIFLISYWEVFCASFL
jgi:hypothetical protein